MKNLKIFLSTKNIKKLLTDKLKRTANFNDKLYKCKIFKKCRKKTYRNCRKRKCKRKDVKKVQKKIENSNNLFRGSDFLNKLLNN